MTAPVPPLNVGDRVAFSRTLAESDIDLFAALTGDFSPNHMDEAYMRTTRYGRRIAHGALIVGFMSRASTMIAERAPAGHPLFPVSLGYDRVRLVRPVFIGDTIMVAYDVANFDSDKSRSLGRVTVTNDAGETVAVAEHVMKWLPREP